MRSSYARRALARAVNSTRKRCALLCEPLEQRRLLAANDPVLVLIEPVQEYFAIHTLPDFQPYLWHSN